MRRLAHAKRRDANEPGIVQALEAIGCTVRRLDLVDLLVGVQSLSGRPLTLLLECKDGDKSPSRRKLTKDQVKFRESWKGHYAVVESIADALIEVRTQRELT